MLGHARSDREFDSYPPARPSRPGRGRDGYRDDERDGDGYGRGDGRGDGHGYGDGRADGYGAENGSGRSNGSGRVNGSARPKGSAKSNGKSNGRSGGKPGGRSKPVGIATEGPYDSEDPAVARLGKTAGRVDFGSLRIPIPARAQLQVEKGSGELLRAVHVLVPSGRVSLSALAAPRSNPLWRGLSGEIADSLSVDGARVRTQWGEWGREVEAGSNGALSRFIGVDGPRWMLYGVATGPADGALELAEVLREMMRKTVVYRGQDPLPVKTVLPLRLPEHLEENVERARDVSAQRPAGSKGAPRSGRPGDTDGSGRSRPAQRGEAARAIGTSGGASAAPLKAPRRPADPPIHNRPAAEAPPIGRRPSVTPPYATPPPGQGPSRYQGRTIGRPAASVPPGSVPAAAQLPPTGPAIGPLGTAGRPVDRRPPVPPAASPPASGYTDTAGGGLRRQGAFPGEPPLLSGYTDTGGGGRNGYRSPISSPVPPLSGHTDPGGAPWPPAPDHPDGGFGTGGFGTGGFGADGFGADGFGTGGAGGGRGATPAHGSLPPISGYTDTGGFARPPGVESTWSLATPVVNADQVSQQPAWALLGDAPSFWPDERYRPGDPGDGPIEMSSVDSLPLDPVSRDPGHGTPASAGLDPFDSTPADGGWGASGSTPDTRDPWDERDGRDGDAWRDRPEPDSWSSPADPPGDLLGTTDSLHAVLTLDDAVTRDRRARADRLGRHRSGDA